MRIDVPSGLSKHLPCLYNERQKIRRASCSTTKASTQLFPSAKPFSPRDVWYTRGVSIEGSSFTNLMATARGGPSSRPLGGLGRATLAARGKSPDFSSYCSFRRLTWRWFIDGSDEPQTANRARSAPRSAPRIDSSRASGPFSPRKAKKDAPGHGPADFGAYRFPSDGASAVPG